MLKYDCFKIFRIFVFNRASAGHGSVAISPDTHWLVTDSDDNTARLWTLWLDELIEIACRTAGRNLTGDEWEQYFRGEEYRQTCPDLPAHWSVSQEDAR